MMDEQENIICLKPTVKKTVIRGEGGVNDFWLHPEVFEEEEFNQKARSIIRNLRYKNDLKNVNNFYADNSMNCRNPADYFNEIFWNKPKYLFVGEAPGINGCALTGIPFTSESLLLRRKVLKGKYHVQGNTNERSATVMWGEIAKLDSLPLLWNIMPLHPYLIDKDNKIKNRTPSSLEKAWGKDIFLEIIALFPNIKIYSVGNHSQRSLKELEMGTEGHMTHPVIAHKFREDFSKLFL